MSRPWPRPPLLAAAEDEVSAAVASLFSSHGNAFQAVSAKAAEFHSQFVQTLRGGAGAYLHTEAANAQSALSHQLGITTATTSGSAATGDYTLSSGTGVTVGPGDYGGRIIVLPGGSIKMGAASKISVAPDSVVMVLGNATYGGSIVLDSSRTLSVGPHSGIFINGGTMRTGNLTAGPDVYLQVASNSSFNVGRPMTFDHSEVNVTPDTDFRTGLYGVGGGPTTISQGNITGSYSVLDKVPIYNQYDIFKFVDIQRDLVVIRKIPYDGGPTVRLR